jgi:hypothetical protein
LALEVERQVTGTPYPDGLSPDNERRGSSTRIHRGWVTLLLLGALLLAALLGTFGGQENEALIAEGPAARLTIETPAILRNGKIFETEIEIEAKTAIAKPVLAVPLSYWRELTINTLEPQPAQSGSEKGYILYELEPAKAGDLLELKIAGQVNTTFIWENEGVLELRDDKAPLARIPLKLRVFP